MSNPNQEQRIVSRRGSLVYEGARLPPSLPVLRGRDLCTCGSGKRFKACCRARTICPHGHSPKLLVIGAGASIEECKRSGKKPDDPFPSIANFGGKLFQESHILEAVTASYLDVHGIAYDPTVLDIYNAAVNGVAFPEGSFERGPLRTFIGVEAADWTKHNVETLFEHAWSMFGHNAELWDDIVYNGVYLYLFFAFTEQFGLGPARNLNAMSAAATVAQTLFAGDRVINLNYDITFDLGLQQSRKFFSYAPNVVLDSIVVHKPHGSFNLYDCRELERWGFSDPSCILGSVSVADMGGTWSPSSGILPPRLNKQYTAHPIATRILEGLSEFTPEVVTFWGVGLTASDIDLLEIYGRACRGAKRVEFINPDVTGVERAAKLLGVEVKHYWSLEEWESANGFEIPSETELLCARATA